jgi:hypothetical protein
MKSMGFCVVTLKICEWLFPFVAVPPVMADMEEQTNLKLTVNETLTLTCNVTGRPHPNIVWFKGSAPVTKQKWSPIKFKDYNRTLVSITTYKK